MVSDLAIRCDATGCVRGLVHRSQGFANPCVLCEGRGSLSFAEVCRRIGENETTMRRLVKPRRPMRPRVAARICGKLLDLIEKTRGFQAR